MNKKMLEKDNDTLLINFKHLHTPDSLLTIKKRLCLTKREDKLCDI